MTCLSCLSDDRTPLVPDTSVLINLHASSFGEQVLAAIPNQIIIPTIVVRELDHETSHANGENGFIQRLISHGVVSVIELDDAAYQIYDTLIQSTGSLDDGEASTIAIASSGGFIPVIDERKGRARATSLMDGRAPAWSLDLLVHPSVQEALPNGGHIEAVHLALREGRMRIQEEHCESVAEMIGLDRAINCTSLPNHKARKKRWARILGSS
jgi:predicted nucleic acid-binding protein